MKSEFEVAFNEISQMRELPRDIVLEALRTALVSAYKKDTNMQSQAVEVIIDPATGRARILVEKEVVDEVVNGATEVTLESARYYDPSAQMGDIVMVQYEGTTKKFGRIAAQTAKQVILQKIREAERKTLMDEYKEREGDLVHGTIQSMSNGNITVSLGRAEAILPKKEQIPGERYKPHDKIRAYILKVEDGTRGPQILVSRAHRSMLRRLLEYEVPEIFNGQVEIKNIAREPGGRSKVAVAALQDGIDPVGACVGPRGSRIQNIVSELHEKIDVIEWSPHQEKFIEKALSPARVAGVYLNDDPDEGRTALVIVPEDALSLAIGKDGQNARLAAKLTGWRIDIRSVPEAVQQALNAIDDPPLATLAVQQTEMVNDVRRIMTKRELGKPVTAEEFTALARFADAAQRRFQALYEQRRKERLAVIEQMRATLPAAAFHVPIDQLELSEPILELLRPFENVGEVLLRFLIDENRVRAALREAPPGAFKQVQDVLDKLIIPEEAYAAAAEAEALAAADAAAAAAIASDAQPTAAPTEGGVEGRDARAERDRAKAQRGQPIAPAPVVVEPTFFDDEDGKGGRKDGSGANKGKKKGSGRNLVYDENRGEVVKKRQHKGGRATGWTAADDDWEE